MTAVEIQRLCKKIGLRPQQAAGQNFLLDENVAADMVSAANIQPGDNVLEIGPGFGILTAALAEAGAQITAVELDQRLGDYMMQRFSGQAQVRIIRDDIFHVRLDELFQDRQYKLVANLPYSATSLVFRNFLTLPPRPESLTVMIQRDVAERVSATPGQMSMLAVMAQYYSTVSYLFDVQPSSFYPVPKVVSAIVHLETRRAGPSDADRRIFRLLRVCFAGRRKQLRNTLAGGLQISTEQADVALEKAGISPNARPQELSVDSWLALAKALS